MRGKLYAASPDGKVKRREKKSDSAERPRPRSTSKSPRNSRIVPGVRIPELKLLKRRSREVTPTEVQEGEEVDRRREESKLQETGHEDPTTPVVAAALPSMAVSEIWADESPNVASKPFLPTEPDHLQQTLTASRVSELGAPAAVNLTLTASSASMTLSGIQPPSLMEDSLVRSGADFDIPTQSNSGAKLPTSKSSPAKMQCRHTQQRKIPEPVRRALGSNISTIPSANSGSVEDLSLGSSASSCLSNLENIRPPTIMADMDNSILSIASIHSEVADADLNTEQIFQHVSPAAKEAEDMARAAAAAAAVAESPSLARKFSSNVEEDATEIQDIEEPTAFDDVSGALTEKTLVPEGPGNPGAATYTVDPAGDADEATCKDVTDVFDDDTTVEQQTFTLESDEKDGTDVEDLPRDSRENTPKMKRKTAVAEVPATPDMKHYREFTVEVPELEDSSECKDTSGYKSDTTTSVPKASPSSRQRRKEDTDRFKTHTITKSDLETSPKSNSPGSSVQKRRGEEAERFRTRTITAQDLKPKAYDTEEVLLDLQQLEQEAKLVVDAITDHKKDLRSRSASVEILDEREMSLQMQLGPMNASGSEPSLVAVSPKKGPKICKPGEGSPRSPADDDGQADARGVRGRRRPLFASPSKRATVPPAVPPKPALAPKPKLASPTNQIRGTRTSSLRQAGGSAKRNASPPSPPSPRLSRNSLSAGNSNSSSARSSTSSRRSIPIPLARQGTFTKEESAVVSSGDESGKPPKVPAKPTTSRTRRDVVHPQSRVASPGAASLSSVSSMTSRSSRLSVGQTRTSALREKSASRHQHATNLRRNNPSSGSNSSLSSLRSGRSGQQQTPVSSMMKPSTSSNALRLQNRKVLDGQLLKGRSEETTNNTSTSSTKSNGGKKEVTSRIANLWKRVEESKKAKQKDDPRIWMANGKVIPESELALMKRHEEQKELVKEFKAKTKDEGKVKSRLSMKLSKFKSGSKKDLKSPTSPVSAEVSTISSNAVTELNLDCVNGNAVQVATSPADCQQDALVEELEVRQNQVSHEADAVDEEETENKRISRMGSYFNPTTSSPNECGLPTADAHPLRFRRDMNNRSPAPAAAIVPPFNYNPPSQTTTPGSNTSNFPAASPNCGTSAAPIKSDKAAAVSDFRVPALPPTMTSKSAVARIAQVRRNDSYVSSMGRRSPKGVVKRQTTTTEATVAEASDSTSQLMTLV